MDLPLRWTESFVSLATLVLGVGGLIAFGAWQASASHVSCGDTIAVDTTLGRDLVGCANNGVVIGPDDISFEVR